MTSHLPPGALSGDDKGRVKAFDTEPIQMMVMKTIATPAEAELDRLYGSNMVIAKSLDKNEVCLPERSEGSLRRLRDSSVATNTLPQSDIKWTLQQP